MDMQKNGDIGDISRKLSECENEMDSLEQKKQQLMQNQWICLQAQVKSLTITTSELRAEIIELKSNVLTKHSKEIETAFKSIKDVQDTLDAKAGEHRASLNERIDYLEKFLGESADKHETMKQTHEEHKTAMNSQIECMHSMLKQAQLDHKATMETRLEYVEGLIGDSADKHAKDIEAASTGLADLQAAITSCAKVEHHSSLQQRLDFLEQFIGESADRHEGMRRVHEEHKSNMEARFGHIDHLDTKLDRLLGESSDRHEAMKQAHEEHRANLNQRIEYLEKFLGESADKHEEMKQLYDSRYDEHTTRMTSHLEYVNALKQSQIEHKTTVETRLEYIETLVGDSAAKHAKEIQTAYTTLAGLNAAITSCAKAEHHSSLEERMTYLEKLLGESADKHESMKQMHEEHRSTVESHLERVGYLDKLLGESVEMQEGLKKTQEEHKATMETRLEYIESLVGDSVEKHVAEISNAQNQLGNIHYALAKCVPMEHHGNLAERIGNVETYLTQSLSRHSNVEATQRRLEEMISHMSDEVKSARDDIEKLVIEGNPVAYTKSLVTTTPVTTTVVGGAAAVQAVQSVSAAVPSYTGVVTPVVVPSPSCSVISSTTRAPSPIGSPNRRPQSPIMQPRVITSSANLPVGRPVSPVPRRDSGQSIPQSGPQRNSRRHSPGPSRNSPASRAAGASPTFTMLPGPAISIPKTPPS